MIRSALSIISVVLFGPILIVLSVVLLPVPFLAGLIGERARVSTMHVLCSIWSKCVVYATLSRVSVIGRQNIPKGPFVLYVNHSSFFDIPLISGFVAWNASFIGRKSLIYWGPIGLWILAGNGILIEQKGTKRELGRILKVVQRIKSGTPFVIFPEGTRTRTGEVGSLKPGTLKIAERAGALLVPVRIEGARKILPRGKKFPKPANVKIFIGEPIAYTEIIEDSASVLSRIEGYFAGEIGRKNNKEERK